jgi:hypothetical protein
MMKMLVIRMMVAVNDMMVVIVIVVNIMNIWATY